MENISIKLVDISLIKANPHQPRKSFDEGKIKELSASIREQGVLQPLLVEKTEDNTYKIIAGERRYRAAVLAGIEKLPVIIKTFNSLQKMEVSIIENVQREELNPMEEAYAYAYLLQEGGMTQEEVAKKIGKSRSAIANSVRLINLPPKIADSVMKNQISSGHARALLSVANPADREFLFKEITEKQLNVRDAENYAVFLNNGGRASRNFEVKNYMDFVSANENKHKKKKKKTLKSREINLIKETENKFNDILKLKIKLKGKLNCGKITINYSSFEDLEKIYTLLGGKNKLVEDEKEL